MLAKHSVLERILRPTEGDLPTEFARKLLSLDFSDEEQARYRELSEKAQLGQLTEQERVELDDLLTANDILAILHAKARKSLNRAPTAA
ncbi:hypothetical protein [Fontivita pretiosa]|uniref:hypothetical protein n=1 Tax=Fontivita pretiosa TaxID=2989684 RepID=UPI003D17FA0B